MQPSVTKFKSMVAYLVAFSVPLTAVVQPFFSYPLDSMFLYFRSLALPILALIYVRNIIEPITFLLMFVYIAILGIIFNQNIEEIYLINVVSIFGSILLFRLGFSLSERYEKKHIWNALMLSVLSINLITILILYLATYDFISQQQLLQTLNKNPIFGLDRFSLGNPIEVPLLTTALLLASIKKSSLNSYFVIIIIMLNLLAAFISGSRIVTVIAVLVFFEYISNGPTRNKIIIGIIFALLSPIIFDLMAFSGINTLQRFENIADSSAYDRLDIYSTFASNLTMSLFMFGAGIGNSYYFMLEKFYSFRSVEGILLEFILDIGFAGTLIYIMALIVKSNFKFQNLLFSVTNIPFMLIIIQILLFLPLNNQTPIIMFAVGATLSIYSNSPRKIVLKRH